MTDEFEVYPLPLDEWQRTYEEARQRATPAQAGAFSKDALLYVRVQPHDDAWYARQQDRRRDRLRYRYERRFGVPLPTYADVKRARERYYESHPRVMFSVYTDTFGVEIKGRPEGAE